MDNNELYKKAKSQMEEIKGFYIHLIWFILINIALFLINLFTYSDYWWFKWPLLGWGIGLASHGISVFWEGKFLGKKWEDDKVNKLMEKYKKEDKK